METKLIRVGSIYIPVKDVEISAEWYAEKLEAERSYQDQDKAILNMAGLSVFLVKSGDNQKNANFLDAKGEERFSVTFEVNGLPALEMNRQKLIDAGVETGEIENRGHAGRNFVFRDPDGNLFDVWSELSPAYQI